MDRTTIARLLRRGGTAATVAGALALATGLALQRRARPLPEAAAEAELEARAHRLFRRARRGLERDSFYLFAPELARLERLLPSVRAAARPPAAELVGTLLDLQRATERGPLGAHGRHYFHERIGRAYLALLDGLGLQAEPAGAGALPGGAAR